MDPLRGISQVRFSCALASILAPWLTLLLTLSSPLDLPTHPHLAVPLSPWNTHIGGEEYEPGAKYFSAEYYPTDADVCGSSYGTCLNETGCEEEEEPSTFWADCGEIDSSYHFAKYLGGADAYPVNLTLDSLREMMNPYDYGYVYEVGAFALILCATQRASATI